MLAAPCLAQSSSLTAADAEKLNAGEFFWRPELAPSGSTRIVVNLPEQRALVYRDNVLIGISTMSSGKPGHETPTGTFSILQKRKLHRSNVYDDAPMPYMERLTWSGLALHGGYVKGEPDSHGCVRLPRKFAQALFKATAIGTKVVITNQDAGEKTSSAE
jgi:lipoprotein-anchoring transpeptidase ErfK/SrfK